MARQQAAKRPPVRWWSMRRAQNLKPATYRCPFCGKHLPALSEHVLVAPEDDRSQRRHAHTKCVLRERRAGNLPNEEEWRRTQPRPPSLWQRFRSRVGKPSPDAAARTRDRRV